MSEVEHWKHCPSSDGGDDYCLVTPLNPRYRRTCSGRECKIKTLIETMEDMKKLEKGYMIGIDDLVREKAKLESTVGELKRTIEGLKQ
jgi:hypothetical protein